MPLYSYKCPECGRECDKFNTIENREFMACDCGFPMNKILSPISRPVIYEYYSEGLGEYVTGPKHKQQLMKAKGLSEAA